MAECTIDFDLLNDDQGVDALLGETSFEASLTQLLNVNKQQLINGADVREITTEQGMYKM